MKALKDGQPDYVANGKRHSIRWRLMLLIGVSVTALWLILAPLLLQSVRSEVQKTLDDRLAASARMVASLMQRQELLDESSEPAWLKQVPVANPAFPANLACKVSTLRGEVVALSQDAPVAVLDQTPEGYSYRKVEGERWRIYTLTSDSLRITTADRVSVRDSLMSSIVLAAALPFALALIGTLVVLWFGIRQGFRPLRQLSQSVAQRDAEDLEALDWQGTPAEVRPLIAAMNRLLLRVQAGQQRERRFTGDAAHELRTPLTAIKTQLQVARMTQGERTEHALDQAERAVERLQATLEQLLLLARIDGNAAFADAPTTTSDEISSIALTDIAAKAKQQQVQIVIDDTCDEPVAAPAALVVTALRNLLDNAIRFSPPGGRVELTARLDQDLVLWTVRDHGPGVPVEQIQSLPNRFLRLDDHGGSGLGLAIVDAISSRFGGSLSLSCNHPHGLIAELRMPIQQQR